MSETFGSALSADVVDKDVQSWDRIAAAVAFRKPSGDELLVARKVLCPDCSHVYAMWLADRDLVSYARRHPSCAVNNRNEEEMEWEDGKQ